MGVIVFFCFLVILYCCPQLFIAFVRNIRKSVEYAFGDTYKYIKYKKNRLLKTGEIIGFLGLFGRGKTLCLVHYLRTIYRAYNGLTVFCPRRKKWVTQRIRILCNVQLLDVPCIPLESLEQVISSCEEVRKYDDEHDTLTCTLVGIDEAGSELNSREFKKNINPLVLSKILTCRHWNISIAYTAQRFLHVDALMRQVTYRVYECQKRWRYQFLKEFDAWELEQAQDPSMICAKSISAWFIEDADFNAYDTYACVDKLKKDIEEGNYKTDEEILASCAPILSNNLDLANNKQKRKRERYLF